MATCRTASGTVLTHPAVHDIRAHHVLRSVDEFSPFMKQAMVEHQCHARLPCNFSPLESRGAAVIPVIEIDHEGEQADLSGLPAERAIRMPGEFLPGRITIEAESFVEAAHLPAVSKWRNSIPDAIP